MTSRLITPLPEGASICSQITTERPPRRSLPTYPCQEWWGTPHMGARPVLPIGREVRVTPMIGAAAWASSKKIS